MTTIVNDLATKAQLAMNRGRLEMAGRRASQLATLTAAKQWANYVEKRFQKCLRVRMRQAK